MTTGPTEFFACPHCSTVSRLTHVESADPADARYWTDGRMRVATVPDRPELARCASCGADYWLVDADRVGMTAPGDPTPAAWPDAEPVATPDAAAYLSAADAAAGDPEREVYARIRAWWLANDPYRDGPVPAGGAPDFAPRMVESLLRLDALVTPDDAENRLLKAEIARELGHFTGAQALLSDPLHDDHYQPVADFIRRLAEQEDRLVRELGQPTE